MAKKIALVLLALSTLALSGCDLIMDMIFGKELTVELTASATSVYSLQEVEFTAIVEGNEGSDASLTFTWHYDYDDFDSEYATDYYSEYAGDTAFYRNVSVTVYDGDRSATSNVIAVSVYPYEGGGTLTFNNDSSYTIQSLFVGPYSSYNWGYDALAYGETIAPSASFSLIKLPPAAVDTDGAYGFAFRLSGGPAGDALLYEYANANIGLDPNGTVVYAITDADITGYSKGLSSRSLGKARSLDR